MTIQIKLPAVVEAGFAARARAQGISLDDYIRMYLIEHAPPLPPDEVSPEEFERLRAEMRKLIPRDRPPLSDDAFLRENLYDDRTER